MPPALRFALRSLGRAPIFSAFVIASVAVGICTITLVGGTIYAALFRPLPYRDADRLVYITKTSNAAHGDWHEPFSGSVYQTLASEPRLALAGIAAFKEIDAVTTTPSGVSDRLRAVAADPELFRVLGVAAQRGRVLAADDATPGAPAAVLISDRLWTRLWNRADRALGAPIRINGQLRTVVGVAPREMEFPTGADVWVPFDVKTSPANAGSVNAVARLSASTDANALSEHLHLLATRLVQDQAGRDTTSIPDDERVAAFNVTALARELRPKTGSSIWLLATITICCLLIGCANVRGLFVLRGAGRSGEMAVRVALGASRLRIATQLLWEGAVLSATGGALGIAGAVFAKGALESFFTSTNQALTVAFAPIVMAVALAGTTIAAMMFAIVPIVRMDTQRLERQLRSQSGATPGKSTSRARQVVVALEIAGALILINASISLTRSAAALDGMQAGVDVRNLAIAKVNLEPAAFPARPAVDAAVANITQAVRRVPGLSGVTVWTTRAPRLSLNAQALRLDGGQEAPVRAVPMLTYDVGDDFFRTLQLHVRSGRAFTAADNASSIAVAIVNQDFANKAWPGVNPIGHRFTLAAYPDAGPLTVVGVVDNAEILRESAAIYTARMNSKLFPLVYRPMSQTGTVAWGTNSHPDLYFALRTTQASAPLEQVRRAIAEAEPYADIERLGSYASFRSVPQLVVSAKAIAVVSAVCVLLGMIGVFGIVQEGVRRRTAELSLRSVLGATSGHILQIVLLEAVVAVVAGTLLYIAVSAGMSAQLSHWLFAITDNNPQGLLVGTDAFEPMVVVMSQGVIWLAVLLACIVPVRRALKIEPAEALRGAS